MSFAFRRRFRFRFSQPKSHGRPVVRATCARQTITTQLYGFFLQYVLFSVTSIGIVVAASADAASASAATVGLEQRYGGGGRVHVMHLGHVAVVQVVVLASERGGRRGRVVARVLVPTVLPSAVPAVVAQARRTPRRRAGPAALQRLLEGHAELPVEVRVDERVESRVEVAHPEHEHRDPPGHPRATAVQQRAHHVPAGEDNVTALQ